MRIYIAGKIGKLPEHIYKAKFETAYHALIMLKFDVVSPLTLEHNHDKTWKAYMREDLKALKGCQAIFMLNNWHDSRGARIEHWYAKRYGKTIIYQPSK